MASSYQDRIKARRGTGVNKKKKVKPVSKDPRPKQSDIGKKYKNYGEFRQAVKAWRIRNGFAKAPKPKEKKKYVSPRERKFGKDKKKENLKISQKVDEYVKKMKGDKPIEKVDYPSKTVEKPKNYKPRADAQVIKDKQEQGENLEKLKKSYKPRADAQVIKDKQEKGKDTLKVKPKRFISDPRKAGRKYSVRSAQGKRLANKLKARERAKEMARKRKEKKKK
jgi:hypothetical protein